MKITKDILRKRQLRNEVVHLSHSISDLETVSAIVDSEKFWGGGEGVDIIFNDEERKEQSSIFDILKPDNWSKWFKEKQAEESFVSFFDNLYGPSYSAQSYSPEETIDRLLEEYSKTGDYRILDRIRNLRDFDRNQFRDFLLKKKVKLKKRLSFIKRELILIDYIINLRTSFLKKIKHLIKRLDDEHELIFN